MKQPPVPPNCPYFKNGKFQMYYCGQKITWRSVCPSLVARVAIGGWVLYRNSQTYGLTVSDEKRHAALERKVDRVIEQWELWMLRKGG